jgi:hypothetical protein
MRIWYSGAYAEAISGLDIKHYPGKWKTAQGLAHKPNSDNYFLPYWERVRLLYLELGGEFIDRRRA